MGLKSSMLPLDEQIRIVDFLMKNLRVGSRAGNMISSENYEGMKAVATWLQARQGIARNDTFIEIERVIHQVARSRTSLGYDEGQMVNLAHVVLRRWPTIAQALENFSKEEAR